VDVCDHAIHVVDNIYDHDQYDSIEELSGPRYIQFRQRVVPQPYLLLVEVLQHILLTTQLILQLTMFSFHCLQILARVGFPIPLVTNGSAPGMFTAAALRVLLLTPVFYK